MSKNYYGIQKNFKKKFESFIKNSKIAKDESYYKSLKPDVKGLPHFAKKKKGNWLHKKFQKCYERKCKNEF